MPPKLKDEQREIAKKEEPIVNQAVDKNEIPMNKEGERKKEKINLEPKEEKRVDEERKHKDQNKNVRISFLPLISKLIIGKNPQSKTTKN
jgi:hypothetical protein